MEIGNELLYVFDSNAVYDYMEHNDNNSQIYGEKFRNDLRTKLKIIPSICLMEIFVKKRNNPKYLMELLQVIGNENFYLSHSQFVCYTSDSLREFYNCPDDFARIFFCNKQLQQKIDIESKMLAYMEACISIQFCGSCAKHYNLDETTYKTLWTESLIQLVPFFQEKISEYLKKGYKENDVKNYSKSIWKSILYTNYDIINDDLSSASKNCGDYSKDKYTKRIKKALSGNVNNSAFQALQKLGVNEYSFYINSDLDFLLECLKESKKDYTNNQLGYLKKMFQNWILNGEALDKNDINDLQYFYLDSDASLRSIKECIGSKTKVKKRNLRYISFDSDMYSYIKQISPKSFSVLSCYLKNPKLKY